MSTVVQAQNLVRNPGFTSDISPWTSGNGSDSQLSWATLDSNGGASSGSGFLRNVSPGPANGVGFEQCLSAVAGTAYALAGKILVPPGAMQMLGSTTRVRVRFYSGPDCTGNSAGTAAAIGGPSAFNVWTRFGPMEVSAPADAASVEVNTLVQKAVAGGETSAYFDDIYFGAPYLFRDGFGDDP